MTDRTEFRLSPGRVRSARLVRGQGKVVATGAELPERARGGRPDAATTPLALHLTILPRFCAPNGTGRRMAAIS
jgi:hypothetical protein